MEQVPAQNFEVNDLSASPPNTMMRARLSTWHPIVSIFGAPSPNSTAPMKRRSAQGSIAPRRVAAGASLTILRHGSTRSTTPITWRLSMKW